jgi:uncharacterized membrane protein YtjA (UPF0391 family)
MRASFYLFLIVSLLIAMPSRAQKASVAYSKKGGVISTPTGKMLVFNNYHDLGLNFSLSFPNVDVQATERPGLYMIKEQPLQVLVVPIAPFKTDSVETTLQRYISNEATYFREEAKLDIKPFANVGKDKTGMMCAIWGFPMPAGTAEGIAQQLFIVFIADNYLVSIGSSQFDNQEISEPLDMLLAAAHSYRTTLQPIELKSRR